ncbi:hypothetical protein RISK_004346 [Rhodopirellula islandica]|uniref:Uncharacterized protein n=1 Tax=Rhodopirellula islandica TaxID=595434 RepID=A0A0J1EDI4_RHOIS|nr:hypothetical protein RISK_004346 [Rhodopirellula islandica]
MGALTKTNQRLIVTARMTNAFQRNTHIQRPKMATMTTNA